MLVSVLVTFSTGILREGHRLAVRVRTRLVAVRRRRVAEAARIQVHLRHHMARRAGHAPTRGERGRLDRGADPHRRLRIAHRHVGQRHVPVFATTRLYVIVSAHHIRTRARLRLGHIQHWILREGHRLAVRVRTRLIAVRRRRVAEAARIQVRLRHHMARRAGHAPTRGERGRLDRGADPHRRLRIAHRHVGQRHVPRVRHHQTVR